MRPDRSHRHHDDEKHRRDFRTRFGEAVGAFVLQPQIHDGAERRDAHADVRAERGGKVDVIQLLNSTLRGLDGCEEDRADVDRDDGQHTDDEPHAEHGFHRLGGTRRDAKWRSGSHSSSVKGKASIHANANTMSNATRIFNRFDTSDTGRPAKIAVAACAAFINTGTKNGKLNIGSNNSARRVFTAIALNNVPTATMPIIAKRTIPDTMNSGLPTGML